MITRVDYWLLQVAKGLLHTTPRLAMSEAHYVEQCSGATSGTPTIFLAARLYVIAWCRGVQAFIIKVALESTQTAEQQATLHGPHSKHNTDRKTLLDVNHVPTMTTGTCRGCASAGCQRKDLSRALVVGRSVACWGRGGKGEGVLHSGCCGCVAPDEAALRHVIARNDDPVALRGRDVMQACVRLGGETQPPFLSFISFLSPAP